MRPRSYLYILVFAMLIFIVSCSGGGGNPAAPPEEGEMEYRSPLLGDGLSAEDVDGHIPMLNVTIQIDTVNLTVEVIENHSALAHYNVRPMLQNPFTCPNLNCISILLTGYDSETHTYTVDVSLRNPSTFVAYDVRGIMFLNPNKDTALRNPDNYFILYDPLEQVNPFKAFAKSAPDRQFVPAGIYTESYQVYIPPPPPLFNINYAIDVSWPGNCREPYEISDIKYEGSLTPSGGSGTISCKVKDHQDDIESVVVDLHSLTGTTEDLIYDDVEDIWSVTVSNVMMQPEGIYRSLIAAKSENYNLKMYDYVDVAIVPGADQYIKGNVFDCYNMNPLDGAEISVVNQDSLGFMPAMEYVSSGEYEVALEPGVYDMSISTVGYDLMTCNGVIVPAGETYEINAGLNLEGEPNLNPYPFTGCVAGKVTDAITGQPIPGAGVRVRSDDLNLFDSPQPKFSSGAASNDNGYYTVDEINVSTDQYSYLPVSNWDVYCSAPGYYAIELTSVGIERNIIVPNVHFQLSPINPADELIFEETFELTTGWTYESYDFYPLNMWHVQEWNNSIVNICIGNGWVYAAPDELDLGVIPEPSISAYYPGPNKNYLWYGEENQGSFLGPYDDFNQTPGGGGTSVEANGGYAVSPSIDLSGYSSGLLMLESWWEIESMNPPSFDYMEIFIRDDFGADQFLDFLNPAVDPYTSADPISSAGHNRDGIWQHLVYDITPYMTNTNAHIVFRFYTSDSAYNGFKGWFIDNIQVLGTS